MISPVVKRGLDLAVAIPAVALTAPLIAILIVLARFDTGESGLFRQTRVGRNGDLFALNKIRSMRVTKDSNTVTVRGDARITPLGARLRQFKLDELPQFWNVLVGDMSLVGPRPDVQGFADELSGPDRRLLDLRPGITGPATLMLREEEAFLAQFDDAEAASRDVLWPLKVRVNSAYQKSATILDDILMVALTIRPDTKRLGTVLDRWEPGLTEDPVVRTLLNVTP